MSSVPPLSASARCTSSGRSRMSRRSSTGLLGFGRGGAFGLDAGDRADLVVGVEIDDAHSHRVAPLRGHVTRVETDDLALGRDHEDVVALADLKHAHDGAVAAAGLDVDDALARAALQPVFVERRALAVAPLRDRQDLSALLHDVGGDDLVALVETDGLDAARARMRVGLELRLLHLPLLRAEEDVAAAGGEVADGHARGHRLALAEREEVDHGLALGLPAALRDLVDLQPVHLAQRGEEEKVRVRRGDEEVLDDVFLFRLHARHALAPAPLAAVGLDVRALDVPRARDSDDHFLVGEEVFDRQLRRLGDDLGAARVTVLLFDLEQLLPDDAHQLGVRGQDALELLDQREHLLVLLDDLVPLQLGQALQPHVQDGLGLDLGELEPRHQRVLGGVGAVRAADDANDHVELLDSLAQAGENVRPLLRARELVPRAAGDHLAPEADERLQHSLEVDDLRAAVDERQHDDPEARLHLGVLVELVQDDLRDPAATQLEHDPDPLPVRLVANLRDALELLLLHELGDLLDEARLVHLVGQLADDDGLAPTPQLLGVRLCP